MVGQALQVSSNELTVGNRHTFEDKDAAWRAGCLCNECPFKNRPFASGYGPPPQEAYGVIIGEAPGANEGVEGRPFVGDSGTLLRGALRWHGVDDEAIYYTNVCLCQPPGNKINAMAAKCCRPRMKEEIKPYWDAGLPFMAAGAISAKALIPGLKKSARGKWWRKGQLIATWHPAYVLRMAKEQARFSEFMMDVAKFARGKPQEMWEPEYTVAQSPSAIEDGIDDIIERCSGKVVCLDLETDQMRWWEHQILCFAIADSERTALVCPSELVYHPRVREALIRLFDSDVQVMGHNIKFDLRFLDHQLGVHNVHAAHDSLIAHYTLNESMMHGLKPLLADYMDVPDYESELVQRYLSSRGDMYGKVPRESLYKYNVYDVCYNLALWNRYLEPELKAQGLWEQPYLYPMMEAHQVLLEMEHEGIPMDIASLGALSEELERAIAELQSTLERMCGREFNANSWKQVGDIMYNHYRMPKVRGRGFKQGSTCFAARLLIQERLSPDSEAYKWLTMFGELKSVIKLKSSYVDNVWKLVSPVNDGSVHPDFLLYGTVTGRLSARDPAIQTIPRTGTGSALGEKWGARIKKCYKAAPTPIPMYQEVHQNDFGQPLLFEYRIGNQLGGQQEIWPDMVIVNIDYSQVEMVVATAMSGDQFLSQVYTEGRDLHGEVALAMFGPDYDKEQRNVCKKFNYAFLYGGTEHSFALDTGLDMAFCRQYVRRYQSLVGGLTAWREESFQRLMSQNYIETLTGRRRRFPMLTTDLLEDARKAAINHPVQGTASDICLISAMRAHNWIKRAHLERVYVSILVHDSIVLRCPKDMADYVIENVSGIMRQTAIEFFPDTPRNWWRVDADVGPSWGELVPYKG